MEEVTLEEMKNFLRITLEDDDENIKGLIEIARIYIDTCVGENYKTNEKKFKMSKLLLKRYVNDMYTNRSTKVSQEEKTDTISNTILEQLSNEEVVSNV